MKHIYPKNMMSSVISVIIEDSLAEAWAALIARNHPDVEMVVEPIERGTLDLGGAMRVNEPDVEASVDDGKMGVPLRHVEFVLPQMRRRQTHYLDVLGEHSFVKGQWHSVILTAATAARVADELEAAAAAKADELEAEWTRHNRASYELGDPADPKAFIATREQMHRNQEIQAQEEANQMPDHDPFDEARLPEEHPISSTAFGLVAATVFSNPQTPQEVADCAEHVAYAIRLALERGKFGDAEAEMVRARWNLMVEAERAADGGAE